MKVAGLIPLLVLGSAPAPTQATFSRDVLGWKVSGSKGNCSARLDAGSTSLLLLSPDVRGKDHGVIGLRDTGWTLKDGPTTIQLAGAGAWARAWPATASSKGKTYWMPLRNPTEIDQFPDNFVMDAREGDRQLVRFFVTDLKAALAANRQCARETASPTAG